ncbi:hypothetical protein WA158_001081 [Blastocystis sp. Blastoise]
MTSEKKETNVEMQDSTAAPVIIDVDGKDTTKAIDENIDPNVRTRKANATSWVGLIVDITLSVAKFIMGTLGNSSAMVADAVHSSTDLITDVIALFIMTAAKKPADKDHPYGHGRYEIAGSVFIAIMLVGVGAYVGYEGIIKLVDQDIQLVEPIALVAAIISIVAKECLFWYTYLIGKQINSPVIIANAWHHRSDAISSIVALIGIGLNLWLKWWWADPVAGLGVAIMIICIGGKIGYSSICSLSDKMTNATLVELTSILDQIECEGYSDLRAREMGPFQIVDLKVYVHSGTHVEDAEALTDMIESRIKQKMSSVIEVLVHVEVVKERDSDVMKSNDNNCINQIRSGIDAIGGIQIEQLRVTGPEPYSVDLHISVIKPVKIEEQIEDLKRVKSFVKGIPGIGETHVSLETNFINENTPYTPATPEQEITQTTPI